MTKRATNWNLGLARRLRQKDYAREFILSYLEAGGNLHSVLRTVIRAYGVKEFAARVRMPSSNLSRALNPRYNPTAETLSRLLKPFGLELTVRSIQKKRAA